MTRINYPHNPRLDLVLERVVDVPRELVWQAWTTPAHLMQWFCPLPWLTVECEIDLRPGGIFRTVMRSPDGSETTTNASYLEVVENEKLVWTDALEQGFRPAGKPNECFKHFFTAIILLEPIKLEGNKDGTRYTVIALHSDEEGRRVHEEQGFYDGWGTALNQMVEIIKQREG